MRYLPLRGDGPPGGRRKILTVSLGWYAYQIKSSSRVKCRKPDLWTDNWVKIGGRSKFSWICNYLVDLIRPGQVIKSTLLIKYTVIIHSQGELGIITEYV